MVAGRHRPRVMRAFGAAQAALFVPLAALDLRMQRAGGPGIIPFELAGTPERAGEMMRRWGEDGRRAARWSLVLDYPFLVAYTGSNLALTSAAGESLSRAGLGSLGAAAPAVAVAQVAAAACDACENTALLGVLATGEEAVSGSRLPATARAFARMKFALLGIGWAYALAGGIAHLRSR